MASKRPLFGLPRAISLLLICLIGYTPVALKPQSDTETEIRVLIQRYFTAYESKDLNGLSSLWNEKSLERAATMQSFRQTFAPNTTIEMKRLEVRKIIYAGDKATARVVVELNAIDTNTGKRSEELVKKNRTLQVTNERGVWRVWRAVSSEEDLAAAISAATTDEERGVLLEADKELITVELRKALVLQGIGFFNRGSYAQAMSIFKLTLTVAQQLDDKIGMATSLRGMAFIYAAQGNYAQALEYDQKSLAISEGLRDKLGITRTLNHIGSIHQSQGKLHPGAREISEEPHNFRRGRRQSWDRSRAD